MCVVFNCCFCSKFLALGTMTSLKVAVRVRPLSEKESIRSSKVVVDVCGKDILVTDVKVPGKHGCDHRIRVHRFTFDYGFWSVEPSSKKCASQRAVYEEFGRVVLNTLLSGYNSCVIAYGPSGSGKTYTMMGNKDDTGLTPRICEGLFTKLTDKSDQQTPFQIDISFMEIYNEQVFDLLKKNENESDRKPKLRVREHPIHGPFVEGLSTHVVQNIDQVCDLLARGNEARVKADTHIHERSSRSHAIFTIRCSQACLDEDKPKEIISKLHLVDLAGSEKAIPQFCPTRLKEGGNINKSLVTLGNVISVLVELSKQGITSHKQIYVPYRDSNLTWLLKDSLGGNSHTFMLAAISPSKECYIETVSTLRYAQRAKLVLNTPVVNEDPSTEMIRNLRKEVTKLKNLLATAEELNKGYIMKPLPEVTQLKSIMNESERQVDILTKHWFEKWLRTYDVILKKYDVLERTEYGLPHEREKEVICKNCSKITLEESNSQTESAECVLMCNDTVGFFKKKSVEKNKNLRTSQEKLEKPICAIPENTFLINRKYFKINNFTDKMKSHCKSFSMPNFSPLFFNNKIDASLTSSHSHAELSKLYDSGFQTKTKEVSNDFENNKDCCTKEEVKNSLDDTNEPPVLIHNRGYDDENESSCSSTVLKADPDGVISPEEQNVIHLIMSETSGTNLDHAESDIPPYLVHIKMNKEDCEKKENSENVAFSILECDSGSVQKLQQDTKALTLGKTLSSLGLESSQKYWNNLTLQQDNKDTEVTIDAMEKNSIEDKKTSVHIDFSERVSEESKQMLEFLKSIRPDSVESSSGCWTPKRKDSEIMSLLSFSSLDGQYLRSLDDISSNEETASVCNEDKKNVRKTNSEKNNENKTDCIKSNKTETSEFMTRKTIHPESSYIMRIPFSTEFDVRKDFNFSRLLESNAQSNVMVNSNEKSSLTSVNNKGFSLHFPEKKKIDWMLENNATKTARIVDISFNKMPYTVNRCRKLHLVDSYRPMCKSSAIQTGNNGRNLNSGHDSWDFENLVTEGKNNTLKTGLKLTKANLDRLAMELKTVSFNKHDNNPQTGKTFSEEAQHVSEFALDNNFVNCNLVAEGHLSDKVHQPEDNIVNMDAEDVKNKSVLRTSTSIIQENPYSNIETSGQFWQSFDTRVYPKNEHENDIVKLNEEEKINCLNISFSYGKPACLQKEKDSILSSTNDSMKSIGLTKVSSNDFWPTMESFALNITKNSDDFASNSIYCDNLASISEENRSNEKIEKETESDFNDSLTLDSLDNFDQEMKAWANKYLTKYELPSNNSLECDKNQSAYATSNEASVLDLKEFELISTSVPSQKNKDVATIPDAIQNMSSSPCSNSSSSDSITYIFVGTDENATKETKTIAVNSHYSSMISSVSLDSLEKTAFHPKVSLCVSPRTLSMDSLVAEELLQQFRNGDIIKMQNNSINRFENCKEINGFKDHASNYQSSKNIFINDCRNIEFKANISETHSADSNHSFVVHSTDKEGHKVSEEDNCQTESIANGFTCNTNNDSLRLTNVDNIKGDPTEIIWALDNQTSSKHLLEEGVILQPILQRESDDYERQRQVETSVFPSLAEEIQIIPTKNVDESNFKRIDNFEEKFSSSKHTQTENHIIKNNCGSSHNCESTMKDVLQLTSRFMEFMTEMMQYLKKNKHYSKPKRFESRRHSCNSKHSCRKLEYCDTTSDSYTRPESPYLVHEVSVHGSHYGRNRDIRCKTGRRLKKQNNPQKGSSFGKQIVSQNIKSKEKMQELLTAELEVSKQNNSATHVLFERQMLKSEKTAVMSNDDFRENRHSDRTNVKQLPGYDLETGTTSTTRHDIETTDKKFTSFVEICKKSPKDHLKNLDDIRRRIVQETKHLKSSEQLTKQCSNENAIIRFHRKDSTSSFSSEGYLSSVSGRTTRSLYSDVQNLNTQSPERKHSSPYHSKTLRSRPLRLDVHADMPVPATQSTSWQNTSADSGAFFMDSPLVEKIDLQDFVDSPGNVIVTHNRNAGTNYMKKPPPISLMLAREKAVDDECKPSTSNVTNNTKCPLTAFPSDSLSSIQSKSPYRTMQYAKEVHPVFRNSNQYDITSTKNLDSAQNTSVDTTSDNEFCKSNMARLEFAKKLSKSNYKLTKDDIEKILLSIEADKQFLRRRRNPIIDRAYSPEINLYSSSSSEQSIFSCSSYKKLPNPVLYLTAHSSGLAS